MRILFVGRNAKIGGGTTFRLNIARGLRQRGHEVWLAAQPGEVLLATVLSASSTSGPRRRPGEDRG